MKVYCKNCTFQHFKDADGYLITEKNCQCLITIKKLNKITGNIDYSFMNGNPEVKNKNNNCIDYKKIWWKFWVRGS